MQISTAVSQLNPAQKEAVLSLKGPLLILAGAGSGKTRVLTLRATQLISQGEASPGEILAVTFTNKAAKEMEHRIVGQLRDLGIPVYEPLWISTFHSTCARILRDRIHLLHYQPFFVIYDDSDQLSMIKKIMGQLNLNEKMYPAKAFRSRINEAKMLALLPEDVSKKASHLMDDKSIAVYTEYEKAMHRANALDFGDLLFKTYELFRHYPAVLEEYQERFKYIMVDEYQDTNHIQYLIIKMLSQAHRNLCVVGDEDQSIYSWRGADISNILDFEKDFPDAKVIKLEENYRSTQNIVTAATHLIKNNSQRKDKTLFTSNDKGSKITVREEKNEYEEARAVVQKIEGLRRDGNYGLKDFAIFYRTNAQSRVLEDLLRSHSLAYRLIGSVKFYERMEVKDILAYLKVVMNSADEISLKRVINTPTRGIGKTTVAQIDDIAFQQKISFYEAILYVAEHRLVHSGACKKLVAFRNLMDELILKSKDLKISELYHLILDKTEYALRLKEENTTESLARIDNLEEFDNAILQFEQERGDEASLQNFLEEMALVSDADTVSDDTDAVTMMTLHISKGLEYPNVFIVGMEDGLFPGARAFDTSDPTEAEEERRLAYVGMTRARENLFLLYARTRKVWGQEQSHPPSRFLKEIPQELVNFETALARPAFLNRFESDSDAGGSGNSLAASGSRNRKKSSDSGAVISFDSYSHSPMPDYEDIPDDGMASHYSKGMRVRHPTFGVGTIYLVEGQGDQQKVSVMFAAQTSKKFIVKYARLERLS